MSEGTEHIADVAAVVRREWLQQVGDTGEQTFFAVGGNSLQAAELMAALSRAFGRRLRLALLLRNPTLSSLTAAVADTLGAQQGSGAL